MNRLLSLLTLLFWFLVPSYPLVSQPKLSLENSNFNLGTIYQGQTKKITILIRNSGTNDLIIKDVEAPCGCTTVTKPQKTLPPSERSNIDVEFNSTGFQGEEKKQVIIESNDPQSPSVVINLQCFVKTEIEPTDKMYNVWLGNIVVGSSVKKILSLKNISSQTLMLSKPNSNSQNLVINIDKSTIKPNEIANPELIVTALSAGYTQSEFQINLSSKNQPSLVMKVTYIGVNP